MERSLSKNESRIVLDLEWRGQQTVRLAELHDALGGTAAYARFMAHQLVKKGWFERLRPGLFQLIPADRGREGIADTNPLTAGATLADPYFFSFGTACTHHGLTEQVFAEIYIVCQEHRRPETMRGKRYVLVYVPRERFFGFEQSLALGQPVQMATLERALLDALDRSQHAGGIAEISRIVRKAAVRVSWDKLLDLLRRWNESALVQRLGYFLDLHRADVPSAVRAQLQQLVHPGVKVHLGSRPRWGTAGRLSRPWNIIENVPPDILIEKGEVGRRRVTFNSREHSVIADKFVDLYARNSGLRDKLVAERDVVLTYALRALHDVGLMKHLAFKGGTCLRKLVFGSAGRFSEDLDFTLDTDAADDDVLVQLIEAFNREYHGIRFTFDDYYKTDGDTSFGGDVHYRHAWNDAGHFRLQVSLRERPTLTVTARPMKPQAYFAYLEFQPFDVASLQTVEMVAEKVRAGFQRAKVRDLYDLHRFATTPFDGELLRQLAVLKLWQARDPFDPAAFFAKIRGGAYDWDDLRRLVRADEQIRVDEILASIETRFGILRQLSDLELLVIDDAKSGRNQRLAERLRTEIRSRFDE